MRLLHTSLLTAILLSVSTISAAASLDYQSLETYSPKPGAARLAPAPQVRPSAPHYLWEVRKGTSLKETLQAWAKAAGWQDVSWEAHQDDLTFEADAKFQGDFVSAVKQLLKALPPSVKLKADVFHENRLLVIGDRL